MINKKKEIERYTNREWETKLEGVKRERDREIPKMDSKDYF